MDGELMEVDDSTFKLAKLQIDRKRKQGHSRSPEFCRSLAGDSSPPLWKDYPNIRRPEFPTSYSCCDGFHPGRTFNSAYHPSSVASIFGGAGRNTTNKSLISPPKFFGSSSSSTFLSPSEYQSYNPQQRNNFMVYQQAPSSSFSAAFYHHQMSSPFSHHQSPPGDIFFQSPMCRSYSQSSGFISTASITTNSHSGSDRNSNDSPPSSASELINPMPKRRSKRMIEEIQEDEEEEEEMEEEPNNLYHSFRAPLAISLFLNIILFFWLFFAPIEKQLEVLDQTCLWLTHTFNFLNFDIANCNFSQRLNEG